MQIDTKNRDGTMAQPGMPFTPSFVPKQSLAPLTGPDAVYSGLLECPCTDRITRSLGASGSSEARVTGTCPHTIDLPADCRLAASKLAASAPSPPSPNSNTSSCSYTEHKGTFLSGYAPGAPAAGWATLAEAQAWCCANGGCGGVTFQGGAYTARASTDPTPFKMPALDSWVLGGGKPSLPFNFSTGESAVLPAGCSLTFDSKSGIDAFFNTDAQSKATCGGSVGSRAAAGTAVSSNGVTVAVALSEASSKATLTLSGPADVWFGVGFGANAMTGTYAVVVDGQGAVSEHKLGDHGETPSPLTHTFSSDNFCHCSCITARRHHHHLLLGAAVTYHSP